MTEATRSLLDALRQDALKWRERAAADGGGIDRKAEETLALVEEVELLRKVAMVCPRCEGQKYDVGSCSLCDNKGALCVCPECGMAGGDHGVGCPRIEPTLVGLGYYSDRAIAERRAAAKVCICPSHASNRGECPIHDEKGRVRG